MKLLIILIFIPEKLLHLKFFVSILDKAINPHNRVLLFTLNFSHSDALYDSTVVTRIQVNMQIIHATIVIESGLFLKKKMSQN